MELLYVHTYVFSGVPEDDREDIRLECERALFGRLGDLQGKPSKHEVPVITTVHVYSSRIRPTSAIPFIQTRYPFHRPGIFTRKAGR